ncbi:class I SAM-dependent methyltransferase [Xinfangfangia sp. D13-10-4-6]|uniref:class I SAM-dependent methyltransferase n=1 Tax=Pseudogemmobacter hezensis TaxID=2737662 RepID=UPI001557F9B8|nr:class I SAM-dependent methyltransferase [Pseudogemmobacter hezensis]NPD15637.1 class I SAM-dependent methyltransferase [Pseudogemmobacter hezensis]
MPSLNRIVMQQVSRQWLRDLDPARLHAAEISGNWGERLGFRSHQAFHFPDFDPCNGPFRNADGKVMKFDIILANQVWEHIERPYAALRSVWKMLRPGGYFWLAVPFFVPYHAVPVDCSRWSARGLRNLLIEGGFDEDSIMAAQWGNRAAALRNLEPAWPPEAGETDDLTNDPNFPLVS